MSNEEKPKKGLSRRTFIAGSAISAAGIAAASLLPGCSPKGTSQQNAPGEAGKASFETPPAPIPDSEIKNTVNTEVVVVGAGMSGLCAAISAVQSGAKVVLLEKLDRPQFRGFELGAIGSKLQKSIGNNLDPDEVTNELLRWSGWRSDQRVVKLWAEHSGAVSDWLVDMAKGMGFEVVSAPIEDQIEVGAPFKTYPTNSAILIPNDKVKMSQEEVPSQATLRYVLGETAKNVGVDIRFNSPAAQLIRPNNQGRVTGIIAGKKGDYTKFIASKGVILCTGDYGNDKEMLNKYIPSSKGIYNVAYNGVQNTGDGHKMGLWVGAAMDEGPHCPMYFDQALVGTPGMKPVSISRQPWLGVSLDGERYANEDLPYGFICNSMRQQDDKDMKWVVWDSKWPEEMQKMHMIICKAMKPPFHIPEEVDGLIKQGIILSANTLDELIQKMKVPAETFKATVSRYNELAKKGKDEDFGKRSTALFPIETAPFYACQLGTSLLVTMGGLKINDKLQVLDPNRKVIPGLYAAGNVSGSFFSDDYPITVSGVSHGRAFTFGYLAGKNAATLN